MGDLFASSGRPPLAERLRPQALGDVVGQPHLTDREGLLTRLAQADRLPSLLFWGPPGSGKTTLARLVAGGRGPAMHELSAASAGVAEVRALLARAPLVLFVDELHRFSRAQQDIFLGPLEDGRLTLLAATTENPAFALSPALTSRMTLALVRPLDDEALACLIERAEALLGRRLPLDEPGRRALVEGAGGDARHLLGQVEALMTLDGAQALSPDEAARFLQRRLPVHDRASDGHYSLISAFHKAVRASDADASLYWLARMLEAGEEPRYIARRMVRIASEDIGLAQPEALAQTLAAADAFERLGSPEGELALFQAAAGLALAPKSNAVYRAAKAARLLASATAGAPPPAHSLNAPTRFAQSLGHGKGYRYDQDHEDGVSGQSHWPEGVPREPLYRPTDRGAERALGVRLEDLARRRAAQGW